MMSARSVVAGLLAVALFTTGILIARTPLAADPAAGPGAGSDPALERTRKQVRMLDDLYKTAIVLITEHYVDEKSDLAAGDAFQALFQAMKQKGHHEVRLLDATGEPYDDDNSPKDAFESTAIAKLKSGESWWEETIERDGRKYLRAATPIPVVMKKCILCHDHYADVPEGQPIGALGYVIPIE